MQHVDALVAKVVERGDAQGGGSFGEGPRASRECAQEHSRILSSAGNGGEQGMYRYEATSVTGFIQQLACVYLRSGYVRAAYGKLPEGKDPAAFDAKQLRRYELTQVTARKRGRLRQQGRATIQFLRFGRVFVILATDGEHEVFLQEEGAIVRDLRKRSLIAFGYSLRVANGHVQVRIADREYQALCANVFELAREHSPEQLATAFRSVPFESYTPVRGQLFGLLAAVNEQRKNAGLELVPRDVVRVRRRIVRPFELPEGVQADPRAA